MSIVFAGLQFNVIVAEVSFNDKIIILMSMATNMMMKLMILL